MKQIAIDGVIGYDVLAQDVRGALADAKGDEVDLTISSPGGSVYEGLSIYNAIRDYRREGGKVNARVIGLAASMATYIPLAADTVAVEDNAVWMIHNPSMLAMGDQRAMRKAADVMEGISNLLAQGYERKSGKSREDIRAMMDDETFFYGDEIVDAGFADSLVPAGEGAETKEDAVALAQVSIDAMSAKIAEELDEVEQIAALMPVDTVEAVAIKEPIPVVDGTNRTAATAGITQEESMDIKAFQSEHPEVFAEAVEIGVKQERARVAELRSYIEADPDNMKLSEVINEAVASGSVVTEINAKIQVAIRDGKALEGENAPAIATAELPMEGVTAEDREAAKLMGMSIEEYLKYSKDGE